MFCILGTHIFYCASLFPKRRTRDNAVEEHMCPGAEGMSLACQHAGISGWKPALVEMGTIPTEVKADGMRRLNQPV